MVDFWLERLEIKVLEGDMGVQSIFQISISLRILIAYKVFEKT